MLSALHHSVDSNIALAKDVFAYEKEPLQDSSFDKDKHPFITKYYELDEP